MLVYFPKRADNARLAESLASLEQAVRFRKRVTLRYVSAARGVEETREVHPYGIAYRDGSWLLVGYCLLRQGVRSFRLDRVVAQNVAPKPKTPDFERPADFDLRRYVNRSPWTYETAERVRVDLVARPPLANVANEDFGAHAEIKRKADGSVSVRFGCTNPDYLVSRVLGGKGALTVKGPESLRARVREELGEVAGQYRDPVGPRTGAPGGRSK